MKKKVELTISEPVYSTFHYQGSGSAILHENPSIYNWFLNEKMLLSCDAGFLNNITITPDVTVEGTSYKDNPHLEIIRIPMRHLNGYIHVVIRNMLDDGFYVAFGGVDDYYVKGKSWYHKRHFDHDGLICGYNQEEKTYSIYAYDQSWRYRVFKTTQRSFDEGRKAQFRKSSYGSIYALKPKKEQVELDPDMIYSRMKEYLGHPTNEITPRKEGRVYGVAVQDYIGIYLNKLIDGSTPYEKIDRRIFRMIWEHKKVMYKRLIAVENKLQLNHDISEQYKPLIKEADDMRMLYAAHRIKRRDAVLPVIQNKLSVVNATEMRLLAMFLEQLEKAHKL